MGNFGAGGYRKMRTASDPVDRMPLIVFNRQITYLLVFDLFALAFAFEFVLFVVAGVVAGVDIGVGDFAALVLLAVLFAGCGPHPPWQPYATTVKMRTSVSAIAFFILVFDLLSSSKIKYSSKFSRFREIPPSSKM